MEKQSQDWLFSMGGKNVRIWPLLVFMNEFLLFKLVPIFLDYLKQFYLPATGKTRRNHFEQFMMQNGCINFILKYSGFIIGLSTWIQYTTRS